MPDKKNLGHAAGPEPQNFVIDNLRAEKDLVEA